MRTMLSLIGAVLILTLAHPAFGSETQGTAAEDFTKHPGYVDFDMLKIFSEDEAKVEINLKQPMLKLVSEFTKKEDPELFSMLEKLFLVRVYVFDADEAMAKKFNTESSKTIKMLDNEGWERVVRVREDDEHVYVYLKPSSDFDLIRGIVVIAVEENHEAVFVNIVGDIDPEQIGRLGKYLNIEQLDSIQSDIKENE